MRKHSGVIAASEERMRGHRPIGQSYLSWLVWTFLLLLFFLIPIRPALAQEAGQSVSVLGAVEIMREERWQPLGVGETLKVGEVVRTGADGRVAVQLANGSQLKINANSQLELKQIAPGEGLIPTKTHPLRNILRLLGGEVWVRGNAEPLEIQTIPVIATIRGTEFNLAVGPSDFARLAVLDGLVEFSNPQGSELVAANEQATAKLGEPPRKTVLLNPLDAVQWSLYYPDPAGDRVEREQAERADPRSPRHWTWAARQHLLRGQAPDARRALDRALALAQNDARAYSLRAAVALVQNRKAEARADAERAVAADPAAPEAHLALSWVQQAEFDLDGALVSARRAVALDPDDPQALIQESRLLFGMGRTKEAIKVAEKARQRAPKDALVNSTWGFLQLARGRVKEADQAFREAIAQDSTLGEPHLGLGLALFRRNQTEAAVEEIRKATLLEPKVSLYNSYLGKAYYEIKDDRLAQKYFEAAKQLDPRDPTPHFYDAIRQQNVNRPVEAVQELQKSIELNDDRAVYRSRFLLDEDLASRAATLGRIYNEIGFGQLGLSEGWKSLASDPTNYSAHRLLADSYSALTRYEIARVSELLQSQLLQPINISPIQPQLAETNLLILQGAGPTTPSIYEFNPLFVQNRPMLFTSGVVGNNHTLSDEVILSGIEDRLSYSFGQFHYQTNGFRENNDLKHDIYNLFTQFSFSPRLSVQGEFRFQETESGDLRLSFDPEDFLPNQRREIRRRTGRIGLHYKFSPKDDIIASIINVNSHHRLNDMEMIIERIEELNLDAQTTRKELTFADIETQSYELQYLHKSTGYNFIVGVGHYDQDRTDNTDIDKSIILLSDPPVLIDRELETSSTDIDTKQTNTYAYSTVNITDDMAWTVGLSVDSFSSPIVQKNKINPKIGLNWHIVPSTTLRAAWFRTIKRPFTANQTIEPTQVSGFNQFFDDIDGTETERYGFAFDQRFSSTVFGGIEVSWRDLITPKFTEKERKTLFEDQNEQFHRAYLYWAPTTSLALSVEYFIEDIEKMLRGAPPKETINTHLIPITISYYQPKEFLAKFSATYVDQSVSTSNAIGNDQFWVLDASVGYRLPKRWGIAQVGIKNLLDENFRFYDINFNTGEPLIPLFQPERIIFAKFTLSF